MTDPNGCGPEWMGKLWFGRKIRSVMFGWFHETSCEKHDEGYIKGGNETRREYCDWKFLISMKNDAKSIGGIRGCIAKKQAYLYYYLVRTFGKKYFNFKE